jgi:hypothetical protein
MPSRILSRPFIVLAALATTLAVALPAQAGAPRPRAPDAARMQYSGDAFGSFANVGTVIKAGKSAVVNLGSCGTLSPPVQSANTVVSVTVPPYVTTGLVNTTADATDEGGVQTASTNADVFSASVLKGLITADEVKAVSATSQDGAGFHVSPSGSVFVNLVVAGIPIIGLPNPNTRIDLAGFGYVILNEQFSKIQSSSASFTVNMIHVFVTLPNPLVPVGTQVIVAHAKSGLLTGIAGTLDGQAYGSAAILAPVVLSGPSALVALGCLGTNGAVRENSVAGIDLTPEFTLGTITDTARGTVSSTSASGETTSTALSVDVAMGTITVDLVAADAHSFTDGTSFTFTDDGSMFTNLSVAGHPEIGDDVGANTKVVIAGLGTLWLKREIVTPNSIEIRMIELIVTVGNTFGIPVGTDIRVAVAEASAH